MQMSDSDLLHSRRSGRKETHRDLQFSVHDSMFIMHEITVMLHLHTLHSLKYMDRGQMHAIM